MMNIDFKRGRTVSGFLWPALLLAILAGCNTDRLVEVEDPASLRPEDLDNPASVPALVAGALRQFVGGYNGFGSANNDAFMSASALISDELYSGDSFTDRLAADRRILNAPLQGNMTDAAFSSLHQARVNSRRAYAVVDKFSTSLTAAADAATKAQLRTIEGYIYVTFSEGWCGAVPFSRVPDEGPIDPSSIEYGPPLDTEEMNDTAVVRFNEALALNAANNLAAVGKGRALLNLGLYAEAAAAVAGVPAAYVFRLEHSSNTAAQNNQMFALFNVRRYGVANLEGGLIRPDTGTSVTAASAEGLPFRGLRDPRVPWQASSPAACFSAGILCWINNNYVSFDSDVPLASGVEARLIRAEAALAADDADGMMGHLNFLRANAATLIRTLYPDQRQVFDMTLPTLSDPGTPAARRELLFRERALWLYNTGHRQGDLRRLVRNYGLPSNQVFPSGPYFRGGNYGEDVAFPPPFREQNNPAFQEAIASCVTTKA